jgi:hypothetical protein
MIDNATLSDWSAIGSCMALFAIAIGVICYWYGRSHAYEQGYWAGRAQARRQLVPRILRAKIDGQRTGRILGIREAIELTQADRSASGETAVQSDEVITKFIIL